jgi:AcrR family transcriptional regulator
VTETPALTRRDRMRAATMEEITATARRLLVEQGPEAASLRAIAREMGMTAPGLYRYYSSRDELLRHVVATIFRELAADIRQAIQQVGPGPASGFTSESAHRNHIALKLVAACREYRRWALNHKDEFALLFGVPVPGFDDGRWDIAAQCALEFAGTFYVLFLELWNALHFPVLPDAEIDPALRPQFSHLRDGLGTDLPDGAILVFTRCWMVLYGAVAMEVFGHLGFALEDPAPMFEFTLGDLARLVGLEYPLPDA